MIPFWNRFGFGGLFDHRVTPARRGKHPGSKRKRVPLRKANRREYKRRKQARQQQRRR